MSKYSDLPIRIIAAVIGAVIIVGGLLYGATTYFVVFLGISILTLWEYYKIVGHQESIPLKFLGTLWGAGLVSLSYGALTQQLPWSALLVLAPIGFLIFILKLYDRKDTQPFESLALTWLGIIYIALPFSLMHLIAFAPGNYDFQLVLGCLLLHWAHDVGAYFTGIRFGKTKLFERWSPKKSWEGTVGGSILAIVVALVGSQWAHSLIWWQWLGMALIVIVAGTLGDLVESQFKRSLSLKDSGSSIPGHGGFMDRFDGLLLSTPLVAAYLKWLFG